MTTEPETITDQETTEDVAWARNLVRLTDYMGVPVFVSPSDGSFRAKLPGRDPLNRKDLATVLREIEKLGTPTTVFTCSVPNHKPYFSRHYGPSIDTKQAIEVRMKERATSHSRVYPESRGEYPTAYVEKLRSIDGRWHDYTKDEVVYRYDESIVRAIQALIAEEDEAVKALHEDFARREHETIDPIREKMRAKLAEAKPLERSDIRR